MLSEEMRAFKDESERSDQRWGELANKMGTLVEDIVAPGIPEVFRTVFAYPEEPGPAAAGPTRATCGSSTCWPSARTCCS